MGLLFGLPLVNLLAAAVTVCVGVFTYFKWRFRYWKNKNVPHPEPSFPYGNVQNPVFSKYSLGVYTKRNYNELKALGHKHAGIYNIVAPVYMPIDPEYVKNVMQRDFHHFTDRGIYYNEEVDPLTAHLFALGGTKWRYIRTKLTPTFTSGKMKMMFDTLIQCATAMKTEMDRLTEGNKPIDIKEMVARFTTDIIGTCAFGLECNSFKGENSDFRKYGKKVFEQHWSTLLRRLILLSQPELGKTLGLKVIPKDISDFFLGVVKATVSYRESNSVVRRDMLQLLIDLKNNAGEDADRNGRKALSIEEVAAQAFVFFIAGFETSSTTMTFCLFELAGHPDIQQKVRDEINQTLKKHNNKITYESMIDMKYMGQVIDETLRKYPPLPLVTRKCVQDYNVPNTDVVIEKGTTVFIPILGIHHDPEFYSDPERFDPERFTEERKKERHPFTYIPFGEGPRICIGLRFGLLQTKVGLTTLLRNYEFSVSSMTKIPLQIDPKNFIYSVKGTIWLEAKKICI